MFNSTLTRRVPLKRTAFKRKAGTPMQRTTMKRAGKKTNEWERVRGLMKAQFSKAGIETCELQYAGCWRDNGLGFAHSKKRRNIIGREIEEAILVCSAVCHERIERLPEKEMGEIVRSTIAKRSVKIPLLGVY